MKLFYILNVYKQNIFFFFTTLLTVNMYFQAEDKNIVQFEFIRLFLSCTNQWIKLRDGDSTASNLLAHLEGTPDFVNPIISTGPYLLIEFFSSLSTLKSGDCFGGFFAQINRIGQLNENYLKRYFHLRIRVYVY